MKKILVLLLMVWSIVLTGSIQAESLDNINGVWQNKNTQNLAVIQDISESSDLNNRAYSPVFSLIVLVIVGFFFAKKHQNIAKVHQELAKKH